MSCFTSEQLSKISNLVREIEKLSDIEKLLLYLQLPCGRADITEGKYKVNGKSNPELFTKKPDQETTQTYTWILSHLEEDSSVSLPKQEVYDEYKAFCQINRFEPLCVADFGKAMKHAFPCIKPRRLGQRGNSKYCYSGLRKKYRLQPPSLLDLSIESTSLCSDAQTNQQQRFDRSQQPAAHDATSTSVNSEPVEHQQHLLPCCEAINLKIEPGHLADEHNHHHHHQRQQHHGRSSHVTQCNEGNGLYVGPQHQPVEHKLHLGNCDSNMTQSDTGSGSQATTNMNNSNAAPPTIHSLGDYHTSGNGATATAGGAPVNQLERTEYPYPGIVQRFGTPDDDDYNHNYQDLNRPIVSELNPFSHNDQLSTCAFGYNQPPVAPSSSVTLHHHHQQQHPHPHHLAQSQHPSSSDTMHASNHHLTPTICVGNKSLHSNQPHSFQANLSNRQQATTNGHTMTNSSTNQQQHNHHHHHSHHHQQSTSDGLKTAEDPTATGANSSIHTHHDDRNQYQSATSKQHPPHLQLSINSDNNSNSSLNQFSSYSRLNHTSIDCCASPFQSPASTPYPMIGGSFGCNEIHDYYPSDCIRYAEQ